MIKHHIRVTHRRWIAPGGWHAGPVSSQDVATVLVPVITAIIGALGVLWQDWRQRRSLAARRKLAFEDAIRQVSFAELWWRAKQSIAPSSGDAGQDTTADPLSFLDNALRLVKSVEPPRFDQDARSLLRRLLLLYGFQRRAAKMLRVVFYLLLTVITVTALVALGNVLAGDASTTRESLAWQLIFAIVLAVVTLVIRFSAVSIEDAAERRSRSALSAQLIPPAVRGR